LRNSLIIICLIEAYGKVAIGLPDDVIVQLEKMTLFWYLLSIKLKMKKYALITGATSGIGKATAEAFADQRINLILCGRRKERLEDIKKELQHKVKVEIMSFDVCSREEVQIAFATLQNEAKNNINILFNNAGGAHGLDLIQNGNYLDWEQMIDSNGRRAGAAPAHPRRQGVEGRPRRGRGADVAAGALA
jgi:NAD(P)-dependent dehydrogenase (short-subunit alcohol dehydrogenase family)